MTNHSILYDTLAGLLAYPGSGYGKTLHFCRSAMSAMDVEAAARLNELSARIDPLSTEQLQELYVQTFELNPVCSLEAGWHLFGENYDRGEFLVLMRQQLRRHGLTESAELPDHLTHILPVIGRMEAREAAQFYESFLGKALSKMMEGIQGKDNPFELLVGAIAGMLEHQHAGRLQEVSS
ncbi:MAG: molecular chaperone TorD family protein [Acidobacteriia bacterium]|nr:molecular chaperone TorD family protein [Terriglobia bacterium]